MTSAYCLTGSPRSAVTQVKPQQPATRSSLSPDMRAPPSSHVPGWLCRSPPLDCGDPSSLDVSWRSIECQHSPSGRGASPSYHQRFVVSVFWAGFQFGSLTRGFTPQSEPPPTPPSQKPSPEPPQICPTALVWNSSHLLGATPTELQIVDAKRSPRSCLRNPTTPFEVRHSFEPPVSQIRHPLCGCQPG